MITVAAEVFKHPGVKEETGVMFAFSFGDSESVPTGPTRAGVAIGNVPADRTVRCEAKLRNPLSGCLCQAPPPSIMAACGWPV